jgi:hypothetical protein
MKTLVEITEERDDTGENGEPLYSRRNAFLWYFGTEFKMIETEFGVIPVTYTVAICSDYETGEVSTVMPSQIKILGKIIKE